MKNSDSKEPRKLSGHVLDLARSLGYTDEQLGVTSQSREIILTDGAKKYFERLHQSNAPRKVSAIELLNRLITAGYVVDDENELIVKKLCLYFSGDPRMASEKYEMNPNKGIALLGGLGVGKTWMMKLLRYNAHLPFALVNCSHISDEVEQGGSENIARYFRVHKTSSRHIYYGKEELGYCFNELGRERMPVKYFGNPTNVMEQIFFTRYENEIPHNLTHFTTNKSVTQLEGLYGDYIRDRMKEMFNLIIFPSDAKSRRK